MPKKGLGLIKIILTIVITLAIISLFFVLGRLSRNDEVKSLNSQVYKLERSSDDFVDIVKFYNYSYTLSRHIYEFSDTYEKYWFDYVVNDKYSTFDEMFAQLKKDTQTKSEIITSYQELVEQTYQRIKLKNKYYLNNKKISSNIVSAYSDLVDYHDYILSNSDLTYLDLNLTKDLKYDSYRLTLELMLTTFINNYDK